MERLGRLVVARRKTILWATLLLAVLSGAAGGTVIDHLSPGGFIDSRTESAEADRLLADEFGTSASSLVLLVEDARGMDDPGVRQAGLALTQRLAREPGVSQVVSYWAAGRSPLLRSRDGRKALIVATLEGDERQVADRMETLAPAYGGNQGGLRVELGGAARANQEMIETTEKDLVRAEAIAFPIVLVALVLVFGSVVAASIPLLMGGVTIVCVLLILRILAALTDISVLATNVITGLGLGLSIDYSLFIISRYREELRAGADTEQAIVAAMRTAGRTVLFSALTVALALSALLVFPFYFLRSFAYAGIPTALVAAVAALVALPALLAVLGPRIETLRILPRRPVPPPGTGFWYRLSMAVMRFPVPVLAGCVAVLLLLGAPFLHLRMSLADERALPPSTSSFQVGQTIREEFPAQESQPVLVVLTGVDDPRGQDALARVTDYAARLSQVPNVAHVETATGSFARGGLVRPGGPEAARFISADGVYLSVVPQVESYSSAGERLLHDVRAVPAPFQALTTGPAAQLVDSLDSLRSAMPAALGVIALSSLVLLFLFTGSVVLPVKALVLNTLSLSATFGALVWGFQDGHLSGLLGDFVVTGAITWTVPILLFCIAFGLSMDYEVFLLSRIKEEYERTGDNVGSVALGIERIGRLVTAAAALVAIVFIAFVTSGITYLKAVGLGLALAVVMDATLVRGALMPAFMRLAGRTNWWAPGPLRRLHGRIGLRESDAGGGRERAAAVGSRGR
jgi:putative drug exporter of the RND superfamily